MIGLLLKYSQVRWKVMRNRAIIINVLFILKRIWFYYTNCVALVYFHKTAGRISFSRRHSRNWLRYPALMNIMLITRTTWLFSRLWTSCLFHLFACLLVSAWHLKKNRAAFNGRYSEEIKIVSRANHAKMSWNVTLLYSLKMHYTMLAKHSLFLPVLVYIGLASVETCEGARAR